MHFAVSCDIWLWKSSLSSVACDKIWQSVIGMHCGTKNMRRGFHMPHLQALPQWNIVVNDDTPYYFSIFCWWNLLYKIICTARIQYNRLTESSQFTNPKLEVFGCSRDDQRTWFPSSNNSWIDDQRQTPALFEEYTLNDKKFELDKER